MPLPRKGETKEDYIARCIPVVIEDGTAKDGTQANAICNSMWAEAQESGDLEEMDYYGVSPHMPYGVTSFKDLEAAQEAEDLATRLQARVDQFASMISRIWYYSEIENKVVAWENLFNEFIEVFQDEMQEEAMETGVYEFSESASEVLEMLAEADEPQTSEAREPLRLNVAIIKPGWGNTKNNNYYPREMLERDAHKFVGAKMYASDHRPEEKSVRTEVSFIEKISGIGPNGEPIAQVAIFDPAFAEATRNRNKLGRLDTLECSILATGKAKRGKIDGRKGNIVEAITNVISVDWVTRAGAGGKALSLAENEEETMPENELLLEEETEPIEQESEEEGDVVTESGDVENVTIEESESAPPDESDESAESTEADEQPATLVLAEVETRLKETTLPSVARGRLAEQEFGTQDDLEAAIAKEIAYLKEVTRSGKPFEHGESNTVEAETLTPEQLEERGQKRFDKIMSEVE